MNKKIEIAPQEEIDRYERTAREFLAQVLQLNYEETLLTDLSNLSDFSSCGLPEELARSVHSLNELYQAWDSWVLQTIAERYRVTLTSVRVRLIELFRQIEAAGSGRTH